ncbi:hypothetical protein [Natrinema soli]|uniref:Pectate lyase superfamily protein domain-containing protein n=1 Tax=Natrinema soli TaxID=1930624 RepID=A0ABD5SJG5_9EURY|nr:hypothetical protein [Natrinema soli]
MDESNYNLASEVPTDARDLWENKPDLRAKYPNRLDATSYDGRSGDLGERIREASGQDTIVELGSGTYEISSEVTAQGNVVGIVGDNARIHYVGTGLENLFNITNVSELAMEGVTFDITEDPASGSTDVCILVSSGISNAAWIEDVRLEGQRHRWQNLGSGYETVGNRYTFLVQVDEGATAFMHRCEFPDGGTDMSAELGTTDDHAIGPNCDWASHGLHVWKECTAEGFFDNGFYVHSSDADGEVILWDCHAKNNARGGMRVSENHTIIGGTTEVIDPIPGDHVGTPLVVNEGANIDVIGLTIRAAGNDWGGNAIQLRTNVEEVTFDKCVLDIQSGNSLPVRMNQSGSATTPTPQITFSDVYFHDDSANTPEMVGVSPPGNTDNGATLTLPDASTARILSVNNDEFLIGTNGTLNVEGTTYTDPTVTASTLGLGDPLDSGGYLPEFYFEYENPPGES